MTWGAVAGAVVGVGAAVYTSGKAGDAADKAAEGAAATSAQSEALNRERYEEAQRLLSGDIQRSDIAQQQLMRELGLPVPSITPYEQQRQGVIAQEGAEADIAQRMADRGIPEFITKKVQVPGPRGSSKSKKTRVKNPEYDAAYQEELAKVRALPAPDSQQRTVEMGLPLEGEYIPASQTVGQTAESGYRSTPAYQDLMGMYDEYGDVVGKPSYEDITRPITDYQDLVRQGTVRAPLDEYQQFLQGSTAVRDPLDEYQQLLRNQGEDPLVAYQRMLNEGTDVTQLPGYQDIVSERLAAVNQGAAGAGALYSGRRGEELAKVGGETQREFYTDYMNRQGNVAQQLSLLGERDIGREGDLATILSNIESGNLDRRGNLATALSNVESGQLNREGQISTALSGVASGRMDQYGALTSAKASTENQFYTNYMNMLQNMSDPSSATNLASLGVNQGLQQGSQNLASQQVASNYALQGTGAQNAAIADLATGAGNIATAYMNQPQQTMTQQVSQYEPMIIPQQQGYTNPNFSPTQGNYSPVSQPDLMQGF